ncbi:hypothetical protein A2U01_0074497, partial [Trifolium medium]|nr:hypothetical protein [Trifolium medium]
PPPLQRNSPPQHQDHTNPPDPRRTTTPAGKQSPKIDQWTPTTRSEPTKLRSATTTTLAQRGSAGDESSPENEREGCLVQKSERARRKDG